MLNLGWGGIASLMFLNEIHSPVKCTALAFTSAKSTSQQKNFSTYNMAMRSHLQPSQLHLLDPF